jgi:hypothetical protein
VHGSIDIAELLRLEQAGWTSLCDGSGDSFYARMMTPEAVMVLADGSALDREQAVASLRDAPAWSSYEISDERLIPLGSGATALVYTGRAFRAAGGPAFVAIMTSVYVRDGDEWRLALYQQTPVPDAE